MDLSVIIQLVLLVGGTLGVLLGVVLVLGLFIQTAAEFLFGKLEGILVSIWPLLADPLSKSGLRIGIIAIVTVGLGVWGAFLYQLDLIYILASVLAELTTVEVPIQITVYGISLTGVVMGMGASYIHDLIVKPLLKHFAPTEKPDARSNG